MSASWSWSCAPSVSSSSLSERSATFSQASTTSSFGYAFATSDINDSIPPPFMTNTSAVDKSFISSGVSWKSCRQPVCGSLRFSSLTPSTPSTMFNAAIYMG